MSDTDVTMNEKDTTQFNSSFLEDFKLLDPANILSKDSAPHAIADLIYNTALQRLLWTLRTKETIPCGPQVLYGNRTIAPFPIFSTSYLTAELRNEYTLSPTLTRHLISIGFPIGLPNTTSGVALLIDILTTEVFGSLCINNRSFYEKDFVIPTPFPHKTVGEKLAFMLSYFVPSGRLTLGGYGTNYSDSTRSVINTLCPQMLVSTPDLNQSLFEYLEAAFVGHSFVSTDFHEREFSREESILHDLAVKALDKDHKEDTTRALSGMATHVTHLHDIAYALTCKRTDGTDTTVFDKDVCPSNCDFIIRSLFTNMYYAGTTITKFLEDPNAEKNVDYIKVLFFARALTSLVTMWRDTCSYDATSISSLLYGISRILERNKQWIQSIIGMCLTVVEFTPEFLQCMIRIG